MKTTIGKSTPAANPAPQPESVDTDGKTALYRAAEQGHVEQIHLLLKNPNIQPNEGRKSASCFEFTALMIAAAMGKIDALRALLADPRVNVNHAKTSGETALFFAVECGYVFIVEELLKNGANVNLARRDGATPLLFAVQNKKSAPIVKRLLDAGANPNQATTNGSTALSYATQLGNPSFVSMLLSKKANPNLADAEGVTPLMIAANNKDALLLNTLLIGFADPNQRMTDGSTALFFAVRNEDVSGVEALLKHKANPNLAVMDKTITPLYLAVQKGNLPVVNALLKGLADPDQVITDSGLRVLFFAAQNGDLPVVNALLTGHANPNLTGTNGNSPLLVAAERGYLRVVEALLTYGAYPNHASTDGATALKLASQLGHLNVVEALLKVGANFNHTGSDNDLTPLLVATAHNHLHIVKALLKAGANPNQASTTPDGLYTTENKNLVKEEYHPPNLFERCLFVVQLKANCVTPLFVAAKMRAVSIVQALLAAGADTEIPTTEGELPLYNALLSKHLDVIQALIPFLKIPVISHISTVISDNDYLEFMHALLSDASAQNYYLNQIIRNTEKMRSAFKENSAFFDALATHRNKIWEHLQKPLNVNMQIDEHDKLLKSIVASRKESKKARHHPLYTLFNAPQPTNNASSLFQPNTIINDIQAQLDLSERQRSTSPQNTK